MAVTKKETAEVVAPSDLEGGYHLEIELNGVVRTLVVPSGGVVAGQTFIGVLVPILDQQQPIVDSVPAPVEEPQYTPGTPVDANIPTKKWRDGLWDCCSNGLCHAACCMGYWCSPVMLGQVMTRMHLNLWARPGNPPSTSKTCMLLSIIFGIYVLLSIIFYIVMAALPPTCTTTYYTLPYYPYQKYNTIVCTLNPGTVAMLCLASIMSVAFGLYVIIVMCMTRRQIRKKYDIPEGCGADDCVSSFFCPCCTICQMARHTNDYNTYPVECCGDGCWNKRGQIDSAPAIVV